MSDTIQIRKTENFLTNKLKSFQLKCIFFYGEYFVINRKTEMDFVNMDDAQRLSWLFTGETFKLAKLI